MKTFLVVTIVSASIIIAGLLTLKNGMDQSKAQQTANAAAIAQQVGF